MKLYDGGKIIIGLLLFIGLFTFPFWYQAMPLKSTTPFDREEKPGGQKCIESKEYIRSYHMQLLYDWRKSVVRDGRRVYVASDGTEWDMSLTTTCMECHGAPAEQREKTGATYCLECHDYSGVNVFCWDCHIDPEEFE